MYLPTNPNEENQMFDPNDPKPEGDTDSESTDTESTETTTEDQTS